jgi:hypothetical protein
MRVKERSFLGWAREPIYEGLQSVELVIVFGQKRCKLGQAGDSKPFQQLTVSFLLIYRHKKGTIFAINANAFH